ncbi:50S ribosomal protein L6 [Alkalibacterium putridalgicola]|uniref:Large ribosomal subunit protein uL6 n=1 Tax=Alkalibacterium putridalgicola TaxID=426703 RepID=A0A1H7VG91_9LACT|nr:50S ribosomal protein L6 [Alkalibacterium putridalgicola]GEK89796.1 50S ribosomal protein L6 [Alkalibacterium putridalgicola]SEM07899.1 large subunit ribosomal protein L6 [Alkalibacterium putridalgicola]
MSRIGKMPITIPEGVEVNIDGNVITVKGKNGELSREISPIIDVKVEDNQMTFERPDESKSSRTIHGTTRAIVNNMVEGVTVGFEKVLELNGVGYRAQKQGNKLVVNVGLSHPVEFEAVEGLTVEVPSNTVISIKGANKEHVGALAANVRSVRPPEPYKGKGIRYRGENVRRKEGKTGK